MFLEKKACINEIIDEIKQNLNTNIVLPQELEVKILPQYSRNQYGRIIRGGYNCETRILYLVGPLWCRKTVIHEILHASSSFSWHPQLCKKIRQEEEIVEGVTEFFTGYILYTKHRNCYQNWINRKYPACQISYEKYTRLFGAATQLYISLQDLINIYFYNPQINWYEEYENFLNKYGLNDFLFDKKKKISAFITLRKEIIRAVKTRVSKEKANEFIDLVDEAPLQIVLDYSKSIK